MRALPRPQGRPGRAGRLLRADRLLQQRRGLQLRRRARRRRPARPRRADGRTARRSARRSRGATPRRGRALRRARRGVGGAARARPRRAQRGAHVEVPPTRRDRVGARRLGDAGLRRLVVARRNRRLRRPLDAGLDRRDALVHAADPAAHDVPARRAAALARAVRPLRRRHRGVRQRDAGRELREVRHGVPRVRARAGRARRARRRTQRRRRVVSAGLRRPLRRRRPAHGHARRARLHGAGGEEPRGAPRRRGVRRAARTLGGARTAPRDARRRPLPRAGRARARRRRRTPARAPARQRHAPGDEVAPHLPLVLEAAAGSVRPDLPAADPARPSTGRRLALANWLVTDGAFVTARVEANRIWQSLFARGICRSSGDFGKLGEAPTHPELLDHLARRLIESGWDREAVQREILASRAYRTSSVGSAEALAADPRNDLFWRHDPRRVTAEEFRDAVLAVSGRLVPTRYGPWTYPEMDPSVLATSSRPNEAWGESGLDEADRRSLYVHVKRSLRFPLLEALDQPSPDLPCPERFPTNVPTQALMIVNGDFTRRCASELANELRSSSDDLRERVATGFVRCFARDASADEIDRQIAFLDRLEERGLDEREAFDVWCLGLISRNEFSWID
ncbi:MAG: DUF1553 domain-containing protein [Planctomycetota bacterium]